MLSDLDFGDEALVRAELHWSAVSAEIISGLAHALSNRLGALAALGEYLSLDASAANRVAKMLNEEYTRLAELLRLLRFLPSKELRPPEAFSIAECVADAVALARHHPTGQNATLSVIGTEGLPAVWGRALELRRTLLLWLVVALQTCSENNSEIVVSCCSNDHTVAVEIRGGIRAKGTWHDAATHLAIVAGATPQTDGAAHNTIELRLPTLPAMRIKTS